MANQTATDLSRVRPNIRTTTGLITGRWVLGTKFPSARGLGRGYDRKAVDAFLLECANGVDWLNGLLIGAEKEIDRLTAGGTATTEVGRPESARSLSRAAANLGQRKRPVSRRRPRVGTAARPTVSRP